MTLRALNRQPGISLVPGQPVNVFDIPGCEFLSNALILPKGLEFSHWERIGKFLQDSQEGILWWIGDWIAYGETYFNEPYAQAIKRITGYEEQTVRNSVFTARAIPPQRRRFALPFSTYSEVASLPPNEQDDFLQKTITDELTRKQLRTKVRVRRAEIEAEEKQAFFDRDFEESIAEWRVLKPMITEFINKHERFLESGELFTGDVDEYLEMGRTRPLEYIVWVVGRGAKTWDGIKKATGYTMATVKELVGKLIENKQLKMSSRGGKGDNQRGAAEKMIVPYGDPVGKDFRYKDKPKTETAEEEKWEKDVEAKDAKCYNS